MSKKSSFSEDWCFILRKQGKNTDFKFLLSVFFDINTVIYDIKSLPGNSFFIKIPASTICSVFKSSEPLEK